MRIIAGSARGRAIETPRGVKTRPTASRVREALFSMVEARRAIAGARVLDLYAGSGALGFEALSRGAENVCAVDVASGCCAIIARNALRLGFEARIRVIKKAANRALEHLVRDSQRFDLVLADPPYAYVPWDDVIYLIDRGMLAPTGLAVIEHAKRIRVPPRLRSWICTKTRVHGISALSIYEDTEAGDSQSVPDGLKVERSKPA